MLLICWVCFLLYSAGGVIRIAVMNVLDDETNVILLCYHGLIWPVTFAKRLWRDAEKATRLFPPKPRKAIMSEPREAYKPYGWMDKGME